MSSIGLFKVNATHVVGGEIFYDYLGNDSFKIKLYLYIDCENGSPQALALDKVAAMAIYRNSDNAQVDTFRVDTLRTDPVNNINYNCLQPPTNICVVRYSYEAYVKLADVAGGYTVVFQRCCRNGTILNVENQDETGGSYFVKIPQRSILGNNSSPRFDQLPPNFLCVNSPFEFKHSATDPDGDSLVYELCIPFAGGSTADPVPRPPLEPPYSNIIMKNGFGVNNFMNANPRLAIKGQTGLLTCTPRNLGQYVVGICVKEYRNGQLLSTVVRDFQFNVINCQFDVVSSFTLPEQACRYKVDFRNESKGAIAYKWNFGDPTTKADTSNSRTVAYTYPSPGWYTAKLISYSKSCSDTFYRRIYVKPDTGAFAGPDVRSCNGESIEIGPTNFFPNSKYKWYPSTFLDSDTARNPIAKPPSKYLYVLKQTFDYCFAYDTVLIDVGPPLIDFDFEPLIECKNLTYKFENSGEGRTFEWDFGTGRQRDVSVKESLFFTFPKEGSYDIKFLASLNPDCKDSLIETIVVVEDTTDFAGPSRLVCFGDSVLLGNTPIKNGLAYTWTPSTYLSDSTSIRPYAKPDKTTTYVVKRSAPYCDVYDSLTLTVDKPEPFFKLAYTFPCDGLNVKVYNESKNCQSVLWDFGVAGSLNDTSSSLDSVSFTYPENGSYNINLLGTSKLGCNWNFAVPLNVFADTAKFAGADTNLCKGQDVEIGLKDTFSFARFRWSPKDSVSDFTISNPIISPYDTGIYVLRKVYPECTFSDTIIVGVHNPFADFSTDYDPHCDVFEISLINESKRVDNIKWNFDHEIFESKADTIKSTFPGSGTYMVTAYAFKEQCADTLQKTFKAFVDTGVILIPDSVICLKDSIFIGSTDTAKNARYLWSPSIGLSNDTIDNPLAKPIETTVYIFQRIFPKCTYTGTVEVRVANPLASFDTIVRPDCYGYSAEFTNTSTGAKNYKWSFSNDSISSIENQSQLFPYGTQLKASLIAIDAHCDDTFNIERALLPFDSFEVNRPNIFTPNGDGYNDCYRIEIPKLPATCKNFTTTFFNRWGQEMFTIEQEGNVLCWDGTNERNGVPVNPGVYFYIINVLNRQFTGSITIVR